MRISDWSSDVCSSDLQEPPPCRMPWTCSARSWGESFPQRESVEDGQGRQPVAAQPRQARPGQQEIVAGVVDLVEQRENLLPDAQRIGRRQGIGMLDQAQQA